MLYLRVMQEEEIKTAIGAAIRARGPGKTICPSEVARMFGADWRSLMPQVRHVAQLMAEAGEVAITQKGAPVDATTARGPIRLGLPE